MCKVNQQVNPLFALSLSKGCAFLVRQAHHEPGFIGMDFAHALVPGLFLIDFQDSCLTLVTTLDNRFPLEPDVDVVERLLGWGWL